MKNNYSLLFALLFCGTSIALQAQTIYLKLTPTISTSPITAGLSRGDVATDNGSSIKLDDYLKISSVQYDFIQTLNIGSQSTGAGAGKITFNPLTITKVVDATSGPLFQAMALGTPFQFAEFLFVSKAGTASSNVVTNKVLLKLAAVKSMSVSSVDCSSGCAGIAESVSFEYGAYLITTYSRDAKGNATPATPVGWNRITNTKDNSPTTPIGK